jgi:GR25 family glycosyltransferase involved in LPS biosynthesis
MSDLAFAITADGCDADRAAPLAIFAINLDRSPERWRDILHHFGRLRWPLYRVAAVDAVRDPEATLAVRGQDITLPPHGIGWNPYRLRLFALVEEACFASHVLAWRKFLESGYERGLILEDDSIPLTGFDTALRALLTEGPAIDIVKLEGIFRAGGRMAVPLRSLGSVGLVRSLRPCSGAAAYVLSRDAARRLLAAAGKLPLPVDDFLWSRGLHGCDLAHVSPWLVMQSGKPSTMTPEREIYRHVKLRDPVSTAAQALRRLALRMSVWWNAMQGRPWTLLAARFARWCPDASYEVTRRSSPPRVEVLYDGRARTAEKLQDARRKNVAKARRRDKAA